MEKNKKNILYIVGFVILIILAYKFSFSNTFEMKSRYTELSKQDVQLTQDLQNTQYLKAQNKHYDSILSKFNISSKVSFQNHLLNTLHTFAKESNLKIMSFEKPHIFNLNATTSKKTYSFGVEGSFGSIVNLVYYLEQTQKAGKISNVLFEKKKDYRTYKESLKATILLQKVDREE